jgi:hypothetical protein
MRWDACVVLCALPVSGIARGADLSASVQAKLLADARVAMYKGAANGADMEYIGGNEDLAQTPTTLQPVTYNFEVQDQRFIYVVIWAAPATEAGLLAEFLVNGIPVLSGDPAWEVCLPQLCLTNADAAPAGSEIARQVRRASRLYAWQRAALIGANGFGASGLIESISGDAAWMWSPVSLGEFSPLTDGTRIQQALIFRINPNELWPEIEIWHEHNVGRGPASGASADGGHYMGGDAGGGGGGSGVDAGGTGPVRGVPDPFPTWDPPGSFSRTADVSHDVPSNPVVPDPKPKPPVVPEPASVLVALAGAACWRRGR